ncbi:BQ2448_20 [Microbotryum intermedium]|uniref:BQ2448_20 protein n=1 Tax=Microbotryum intermedium TaxID=269621 RepID=A0A238FL59_9BASI|nr:BQ2448_20 [Microbotryum intermedium]
MSPMSPLTREEFKSVPSRVGADSGTSVTRFILSKRAADAIFADPIAYAEGYDQYSAQWAGMSIFESSETLAWKVTKNEPPILEYELRQRYVLPVTGQEKIMTSLVHIELDRNDKIVKLEDRWDGKPLPGRVAKAMSDFSATYIVPALVNVDKVDKENKAKQ